MSSDKEKAAEAAQSLRTFLRGMPGGQDKLDCIMRFNGELRRTNSTLKSQVEVLQTASADQRKKLEVAESLISQAHRELDDLRQKLQQATTAADVAALEFADDQRRQRYWRKRSRPGQPLPKPTVSSLESTLAAQAGTWTEADVNTLLTNPIHAGVGPFPRIVSDERWVDAATKLVWDYGPRQYFVNLLTVLRQVWEADASPGPETQAKFDAMRDAIDCDDVRLDKGLGPNLDDPSARTAFEFYILEPFSDSDRGTFITETIESTDKLLAWQSLAKKYEGTGKVVVDSPIYNERPAD